MIRGSLPYCTSGGDTVKLYLERGVLLKNSNDIYANDIYTHDIYTLDIYTYSPGADLAVLEVLVDGAAAVARQHGGVRLVPAYLFIR